MTKVTVMTNWESRLPGGANWESRHLGGANWASRLPGGAKPQNVMAWYSLEEFVATNLNLSTRDNGLPSEGQSEFVATNFPLPLLRESRSYADVYA